jgi:hypothetical protein
LAAYSTSYSCIYTGNVRTYKVRFTPSLPFNPQLLHQRACGATRFPRQVKLFHHWSLQQRLRLLPHISTCVAATP